MKKRGVTLVEVLVGFFLTSVLLTVLLTVLVPAMRAWTDGQKRSELGQSLLVTTSWLGDDIVRSAKDSISLNDQGMLIMRCALGQQDSHENEFNETVVYWIEGKELFRADKSTSGSGSGSPEITPEDLETFDSQRKVASGVEVFEVNVVKPWRVDLYMKVEKNGRSAEIRTGYSSIYAPLDPNKATELEEEASEP